MPLSCKELEKEYQTLISWQEEFALILISANQANLSDVLKLRKKLESKISYIWELLSNLPPEWKDFYQTEFNLDLSKVRIKIPEKKEGFDCLLIVAPGLTPNQAYEACQKHFPCHRYTEDLDKEITHNDREPTKPYAIWVKDNPASDENLQNKSANDIKKQNIPTETLTERLIHELKYFRETNQHLDTNTFTLCGGSRLRDGGVPVVDWRGGGMGVHWYVPGLALDHLRPRQVVS